jgi:glycosyltransferase involved in cell wall biosynthesis
MSFIPNGYDLSHFKPRPKDAAVLRFNLGYSPEMPLIGMVGRYTPQKDHANLLHALAILKSRRVVIRCLLLGNKINIRNSQLIELIENLKLKDIVVLLDRQNEVPTVMSALDVHVLPSSFGEAFPNVVAESMACETPCIVTDVGDSAKIVGHTGWVVPPHNAQALADTIEHALLAHKNQTIWAQRKINARNRIEQKFSLDNMIKNYHTAWDKTRLGLMFKN